MDYFQRLENAGFSVDVNYYSKKFSETDRKKFGLLENEILPVVKKF
jgi:hypothetical protein